MTKFVKLCLSAVIIGVCMLVCYIQPAQAAAPYCHLVVTNNGCETQNLNVGDELIITLEPNVKMVSANVKNTNSKYIGLVYIYTNDVLDRRKLVGNGKTSPTYIDTSNSEYVTIKNASNNGIVMEVSDVNGYNSW
ncbi:hypothetical protein [Moorena sp. SIO4G3]|uniref:hypothetical protein n=1 Tax=Moorena sp. SIO4G3 TaxID=2607821 RepID=UPI00142BEC70|nr:hypothetical protein [Moorena sp. SIO4G3]NEO77178.1 hypothetical protein [Moorena sp. SIO4G3]